MLDVLNSLGKPWDNWKFYNLLISVLRWCGNLTEEMCNMKSIFPLIKLKDEVYEGRQHRE